MPNLERTPHSDSLKLLYISLFETTFLSKCSTYLFFAYYNCIPFLCHFLTNKMTINFNVFYPFTLHRVEAI